MMGLSVVLNEADVTLNEVGRLELWRRGYDCLHDMSSLMRSGVVTGQSLLTGYNATCCLLHQASSGISHALRVERMRNFLCQSRAQPAAAPGWASLGINQYCRIPRDVTLGIGCNCLVLSILWCPRVRLHLQYALASQTGCAEHYRAAACSRAHSQSSFPSVVLAPPNGKGPAYSSQIRRSPFSQYPGTTRSGKHQSRAK